jgi:acetate kinase
MYLLAVNCGSSSIKGKLYAIPPAKSDPLETVADLGVSNISSKGEKVKIKVTWSNGKGKDVNEDGEDGGSVECEACLLIGD